MSHLSFLISFFFSFTVQSVYSQKKWDGGGSSNQWNDPLNWTGNTIPGLTEDVILDNSFIGISYNVTLPALPVTVKSILITPVSGRTVELLLPPQNISTPGLIVAGPGYGLTINSGGVFRNSSGAATGNGVRVSDSIRINNDGRYIHNTTGGHASNVQVLSAAPGTERGIFELDIPSASSTISMSGRTFGRFLLRATAAGGGCNYTAAGTSRVMIRDNFEIGAGVNLNLNFSDTIFIQSDLIQDGGTFNLGNTGRSVVVTVGRHITQSPGAFITETGTGIQSIVLYGSVPNLVAIRGSILNQVALVKNGTGLSLLKAHLSLPHKLSLKNGILVTNSQSVLTLMPSCTIEADSLSGQSFIAGPLKKDGLNNQGFLFPVGKSTQMRWFRLEQATGNFTVEYFKTDPNTLGNEIGDGLHHISTIEYWDVTSSPASSAFIKLSYSDPYSGGVTDLSYLRVARLTNTRWENAGNTAFSGNPGSNGWVSSTTAGGFSANNKSFALASAISQENPLPFYQISFNAKRKNHLVEFKWEIGSDINAEAFELQHSPDGKEFKTFHEINGVEGRRKYSFDYSGLRNISGSYRVRVRSSEGTSFDSESMTLRTERINKLRIKGSNIISQVLDLSLTSERSLPLSFVIYRATGENVKWHRCAVMEGLTIISVDVSELKAGIYYISEISGAMPEKPACFIKL